jgi:calcineurin-like phosphoesterase
MHLEGPLLDWFDSIQAMGVDIRVWDQTEARFKIVFEAAPSASSVVYKITEIKQSDHEDVYEYFSRSIKTMIEFKSKINPNTFVLLPVELTQAQSALYEELPEAIKIAVTTHVHNSSADMVLNNVSAILITARLKSELRTEILKNNFITLR